jgi:hypothetical protein
MRVFLIFAREACAFGKKRNLPAWSDGELDQRCREFLLSITVEAWEDKGQHLGISKMSPLPTIGDIRWTMISNEESKTPRMERASGTAA